MMFSFTDTNELLRLWKKVKRTLISKEALTFSLFLLLSTCFWFVHALSGVRVTQLRVPVVFNGIPDHIAIASNTPQHLTVRVKDEGKRLFSYRKEKIQPIHIDLSGAFDEGSKEILISAEVLRARLSEQLLSSSSLIDVTPESIILPYEQLISKQVPIRFYGELTAAPQYRIRGDVELFPSNVLVYGKQEMVDTLTALYTHFSTFHEIKDSVQQVLSVSHHPDLRLSKSTVLATVSAAMFTEKRLLIPIRIENVPSSLFVRIFPSDATVTMNVLVSSFAAIKEKDVTVIFDYNDIADAVGGKVALKSRSNHPDVLNVRVKPTEVEFIIEKRSGE